MPERASVGELDGPPVLRGEAAELNRAERVMNDGRFTEKDWRLWQWLMNYRNTQPGPVEIYRGPYRSVINWDGEKIWPPD